MSAGISPLQPVLLYDANGVPIPLGQAAMAASLPVAIASDQSAVPMSMPDATASGTINGNGQTAATLALAGHKSVSYELNGTFSGTLVVQTSSDGGVNYVAGLGYFVPSSPASNRQSSLVISGTVLIGGAVIVPNGVTHIRFLSTAFTSGSIVCTLTATSIDQNFSRFAGVPSQTTFPPEAVYVAGTDGANFRPFATDTSGRQMVVGPDAVGGAVTGNPLLMAGFDGSSLRRAGIHQVSNSATNYALETMGALSFANAASFTTVGQSTSMIVTGLKSVSIVITPSTSVGAVIAFTIDIDGSSAFFPFFMSLVNSPGGAFGGPPVSSVNVPSSVGRSVYQAFVPVGSAVTVKASLTAITSGSVQVSFAAADSSIDANYGQATMANSRPVVIASDQLVPVVGPGADGAAVTGNPVRIAGSDGVNTQDLLTDTSGRPIVVGPSAIGAPVVGSPVLVGGRDASGNAQFLGAYVNRTTPGTLVGLPIVGLDNDGILRVPRTSRDAQLMTTSDCLLWHDAFEGNTVNAFWTQSTTTMTIAQGAGILTLNNSGITTLNTDAIITSQRQFMKYPTRTLRARFRANFNGPASNHTLVEFGFGSPVGVTATQINSAHIRQTAAGVLQGVITINSTETTVTLAAQGVLNQSLFYDFEIVIADEFARFIATSSDTSNPALQTVLFDQSLRFPGNDAPGMFGTVSHLPTFARVYTDATGGGTVVQLKISEHDVNVADGMMGLAWCEQSVLKMRQANIGPTNYTQTAQLAAGAAPGAFSPSNTVAGNAFLGGEAQVNSTASSENLLSIFAFTVPSPYTLMLNGLFIPRPVITTALTTTACILEMFLIVNAASGNISTGGGQRYSLGLFSAPASSAAATILNGSDINWQPRAPIACLPNTVVHIGWKIILGAATGVFRVVAVPDGYFM